MGDVNEEAYSKKYRGDANDGTMAQGKAQPPPMLSPGLARSLLSQVR